MEVKSVRLCSDTPNRYGHPRLATSLQFIPCVHSTLEIDHLRMLEGGKVQQEWRQLPYLTLGRCGTPGS